MMVAGLWEVMFLKDVITYRLPMLTMASLIRPSELLRKNKSTQRWEGHVLGGIQEKLGGVGGGHGQNTLYVCMKLSKNK